MGDGMLAYFGYPQAHEHDAERAGLGIVEATPKIVTSDRRKTFRAGRRQRNRLKLRRPPERLFRRRRVT
jgi:class 3 adenylate cyclase